MIAIGIDPGTAITGYGLIRLEGTGDLTALEYGVIRTSSKKLLPERLVILFDDLSAVLNESQPDTAAVEKLFFQKNVTTAMSVGQARGVAVLCLEQASIPQGEYTPLQIKQAVTGYGGAEKSQVQNMVKTLLGLDEIPRPDDAADALAVAICHLHSIGTTQRLVDNQ